MIFFGNRINFLFAAVLSIPVWLAAYTYIHSMQVSEDEAVSTGVTMCFFAGVFTGRYLAGAWKFHTMVKPSRLIFILSAFVLLCVCWLFLHADYPLGGHFINLLLYVVPFLTLSIASGILVKTIRTLAEKKLNDAQRAAAHSESELRLLQSQLSPHFLFNTLNNLYGLSLTQQEKIPPLLLRLSDLLRHTVYGVNETFVSLASEAEYLANYIAFEQIRLGDRLVLQSDIQVLPGNNFQIAPMLLIVFVENAFKHAKNSTHEQIYIELKLSTWNDMILFSVKNSYSSQEKQFDRHSGFGLDNVRKRLNLLYGDEHRLEVETDEHMYCVVLWLKNKML